MNVKMQVGVGLQRHLVDLSDPDALPLGRHAVQWTEENYFELHGLFATMRADLYRLGAPFKSGVNYDLWLNVILAMTSLNRGNEDGPGADIHMYGVTQLQRTARKCPPPPPPPPSYPSSPDNIAVGASQPRVKL